MRLENKVALISGGARGMGAVEARLFAKEGAKVVIGDIREEEGRQIEAQIAEAGGECLFIFLDVTKEANWAEAVDSTVARFGPGIIVDRLPGAGVLSSRSIGLGPGPVEMGNLGSIPADPGSLQS